MLKFPADPMAGVGPAIEEQCEPIRAQMKELELAVAMTVHASLVEELRVKVDDLETTVTDGTSSKDLVTIEQLQQSLQGLVTTDQLQKSIEKAAKQIKLKMPPPAEIDLEATAAAAAEAAAKSVSSLETQLKEASEQSKALVHGFADLQTQFTQVTSEGSELSCTVETLDEHVSKELARIESTLGRVAQKLSGGRQSVEEDVPLMLVSSIAPNSSNPGGYSVTMTGVQPGGGRCRSSEGGGGVSPHARAPELVPIACPKLATPSRTQNAMPLPKLRPVGGMSMRRNTLGSGALAGTKRMKQSTETGYGEDSITTPEPFMGDTLHSPVAADVAVTSEKAQWLSPMAQRDKREMAKKSKGMTFIMNLPTTPQTPPQGLVGVRRPSYTLDSRPFSR